VGKGPCLIPKKQRPGFGEKRRERHIVDPRLEKTAPKKEQITRKEEVHIQEGGGKGAVLSGNFSEDKERGSNHSPQNNPATVERTKIGNVLRESGTANNKEGGRKEPSE